MYDIYVRMTAWLFHIIYIYEWNSYRYMLYPNIYNFVNFICLTWLEYPWGVRSRNESNLLRNTHCSVFEVYCWKNHQPSFSVIPVLQKLLILLLFSVETLLISTSTTLYFKSFSNSFGAIIRSAGTDISTQRHFLNIYYYIMKSMLFGCIFCFRCYNSIYEYRDSDRLL